MPCFTPFFINTNLCYTPQECENLRVFIDNIAGNTGNSYIAYSILKLLYGKIIPVPEIKNLWNYDFAQSDALAEQINQCHSHVIFCLQDQIRLAQSYAIFPDWAKINTFLTKLKKPFIVFSLGANRFAQEDSDFWTHLPADLVRFLHILADHSVSLGVRGQYTQEILQKMGIKNAKPIGCPTFFETGPDRKIIKKPWQGFSSLLTSEAMDPHMPFPFSGVIQDEKALLKLLYFPEAQEAEPELSLPALWALNKGHIHCFAGIEQWKAFLSHYSASITSRMHGGIIALNCGLPTLITNQDLRAQEMCRLFKIPQLPGMPPLEKWRSVYEQADFEPMNKQYPQLYQNFFDWLDENGISASVIEQKHQEAQSVPALSEPVLPTNPHFVQWAEHSILKNDYYIPTGACIEKLKQKLFSKLHS